MSRFATTQLSSPDYECNNLRCITVKTPNLPGRGDINVFVPPGLEQTNLPIVTLLHGVYGSSWAWALRGAAHLTAWQLIESGEIQPMILAMPSDGLWQDGSFYLNHHGYDFEKWIVEDVPDAVRLLIPQAAESTQQCIAGLSMGGFGAMRIGAKYPNRYLGISGLSAITHLNQAHHFTAEVIEDIHPTDQSILETMRKNKAHLPPVRFDCGSDDLLIEYNRQLHHDLTASGIDHHYAEHPGKHEWSYWAEHLKDTLRFFDTCMK